MTVRDLIDALRDYPPDASVVLCGASKRIHMALGGIEREHLSGLVMLLSLNDVLQEEHSIRPCGPEQPGCTAENSQ